MTATPDIKRTMMTFLPLLMLLRIIGAAFTNCASSFTSLPVTELYIDPPGIVAAHQPVYVRINFQVPKDTFIPHGLVELSTNWNGLAMTTIRHGLDEYFNLPLLPGDHNLTRSFEFPPNVWGRMSTTFNVYNSSGTNILCAHWVVFATGTDKNETSWPWSALYA